MPIRSHFSPALLAIFLAISLSCGAYEEGSENADDSQRRYTYSWLFSEDDAMRPRGGTTKGPEVKLATGFSEAWMNVTEAGISDQERDRRAILAMAGAYRTTFDFIETVGFTGDYSPSRPYQSWGTEYVYVVADEPDFVSLQHILVMRIKGEDGELSDPIVIKHWRHDWTYEDRDLMEYSGHQHWTPRKLDRKEVRGSWSQAVFQVDDSPRYETWGRWHHESGYSHWESAETIRPLPRREFSVRDDYHALKGNMRISITPNGWVMEEDALKTVMTGPGQIRAQTPYLAREAGISRYERIVNFDFGAGDEYWARTGSFWSDVRGFWADLFAQNRPFHLEKSVDGRALFAVMFSMADGDYDETKTIADAIAPYLEVREQ